MSLFRSEVTMKKALFLVWIAALMGCSIVANATQAIISEMPDGTRYIANRVIIMLNDGYENYNLRDEVIYNLESIPGVVKVEPLYNGSIRKPALRAAVSKIYEVTLDESHDALFMIGSCRTVNGVKSAEIQSIPNFYYTPNDPNIGQYWHLEQTQVFQAWDHVRGDTTKYSIIGVIDTGINTSHGDIAPNMWVNELEDINHDGVFDSSDIDGIDNDGNGYRDDGMGWNFANDNNDIIDRFVHGTGVASCVSEATDNGYLGAGAGFSARLMALKGINDAGYLIEAAQCMIYAVDNGAQIITCGWGTPVYHEYEQHLINIFWDLGVIVIAAAGIYDPIVYPAGYEHVVAVTATDQNDRLAVFAPAGDYIDICAPGVNIPVIWGDEYSFLSGTSFSTGIVSGITALVRAWYPSYTNEEVWQIIADAADPIDSLNPGHEGQLGAGRINAANCFMTGINDEPQLPSQTRLLGCYPNPFNLTANLKYELNKAAEVSIDIYDILGRRVARLEPGLQQAGQHSFAWNACHLPSGVYFARLNPIAGGTYLKMILLK